MFALIVNTIFFYTVIPKHRLNIMLYAAAMALLVCRLIIRAWSRAHLTKRCSQARPHDDICRFSSINPPRRNRRILCSPQSEFPCADAPIRRDDVPATAACLDIGVIAIYPSGPSHDMSATMSVRDGKVIPTRNSSITALSASVKISRKGAVFREQCASVSEAGAHANRASFSRWPRTLCARLLHSCFQFREIRQPRGGSARASNRV